MSGGSWDYLFGRMDDAADRLKEAKCPHRRVIGKIMKSLAMVMYEIEWADSGDTSPERALEAIKKFLGKEGPKLALREGVEQAKATQAELAKLITDAEASL